MKLATYKDGSRDGQLVVVSRDLRQAHFASAAASRLQQLLDDWNFLSPQLEELSQRLNSGKARHAFAFDANECMAPLPRAFQWLDGARFVDASMPQRSQPSAGPALCAASDPMMVRGPSDEFLGACDSIVCTDPSLGIDREAKVAVITGDVPMGTGADAALEGIRLVMLANEASLRHLARDELAAGGAHFQSVPAIGFSPVAVTPDELAGAWRDGRLHLDLVSEWNGKRFGVSHCGQMRHHFGELIAHACKTRNVRAGTVLTSGAAPPAYPSDGYACVAHLRATESAKSGAPKSEFMQFGDAVRVEMLGPDGASLFGAIDQRIEAHP